MKLEELQALRTRRDALVMRVALGFDRHEDRGLEQLAANAVIVTEHAEKLYGRQIRDDALAAQLVALRSANLPGGQLHKVEAEVTGEAPSGWLRPFPPELVAYNTTTGIYSARSALKAMSDDEIRAAVTS